jgi:CDP-diacylglycerol pyrophosphatase
MDFRVLLIEHNHRMRSVVGHIYFPNRWEARDFVSKYNAQVDLDAPLPAYYMQARIDD